MLASDLKIQLLCPPNVPSTEVERVYILILVCLVLMG